MKFGTSGLVDSASLGNPVWNANTTLIFEAINPIILKSFHEKIHLSPCILYLKELNDLKIKKRFFTTNIDAGTETGNTQVDGGPRAEVGDAKTETGNAQMGGRSRTGAGAMAGLGMAG